MSATSQEVREWASQQDPPLAKPNTRGRLARAAIDAYNAAHAANPYSPDGKLAHILPVPEKPTEGVQAVAEHPGTEVNPSSGAVEFTEPGPVVTEEAAEPLQQPSTPFTDTSDDFSDGSDYDPAKTPNVHYVDFSSERYSEAP